MTFSVDFAIEDARPALSKIELAEQAEAQCAGSGSLALLAWDMVGCLGEGAMGDDHNYLIKVVGHYGDYQMLNVSIYKEGEQA